MPDFNELRTQARSLEHQTDQLLHQISVDSTAADRVEPQLKAVLAQRQELVDQMQSAVDADGSPGTKVHHIERHRQTLRDHARELRRIQSAIQEARDREELLSSMRRSANTRAAEDYTLTQERSRIDESHGMMDELLERAYITRDSFLSQRASLMQVQQRLGNAASKIPGLNLLIKKIDTRKKRDAVILASLISFCILVLFFWS